MAFLKLLLLFVIFVFAQKSEALRRSRIIGGDAASVKQFPYQVSMHRREDQRYFCGGAILNERFIVSAGHCFFGKRNRAADKIYATVGEVNLKNKQAYRLKIFKIRVHPDFDLEFTWNDIALLQTKRKIKFSEIVQPISLPTVDVQGGLSVIVSGFGYTETLNGSVISLRASNELQYQETKVIDLDICRNKFVRRMFESDDDYTNVLMSVNKNVICTKNPFGKGACIGDSGAPLVSSANNTLVGIVSWSVGCAEGHPDVYTRVYSYRDWIQTEQRVMLKSL